MADGPARAFCHSPPGEDDQEPWFNVVYTCWIVSNGSIHVGLSQTVQLSLLYLCCLNRIRMLLNKSATNECVVSLPYSQCLPWAYRITTLNLWYT